MVTENAYCCHGMKRMYLILQRWDRKLQSASDLPVTGTSMGKQNQTEEIQPIRRTCSGQRKAGRREIINPFQMVFKHCQVRAEHLPFPAF